MSNRVEKKKQKFVQVQNTFIRNKDISFKAKGLFCYMYSMSGDWNFTIKSIAKQQKDGEASIISAINELKEHGFVKYTKHPDGTGTYFLDDEPNLENPNLENPNLGKSTRIKKTELNKNKNSKYDAFINYLKEKAKYKSKVTKTKEGEKLFKQIEDKKQLVIDYLKHQEEKKEYSVRITSFMLDYETVYKKSDWNDGYNNSNKEWGE